MEGDGLQGGEDRQASHTLDTRCFGGGISTVPHLIVHWLQCWFPVHLKFIPRTLIWESDQVLFFTGIKNREKLNLPAPF